MKPVDLSLSIKISSDTKLSSTDGNIYFLAPECCLDEGEGFSPKPLDIWSLGVTLWVLVFNKLPFMPETEGNMIELMDLISKAESFIFIQSCFPQY